MSSHNSGNNSKSILKRPSSSSYMKGGGGRDDQDNFDDDNYNSKKNPPTLKAFTAKSWLEFHESTLTFFGQHFYILAETMSNMCLPNILSDAEIRVEMTDTIAIKSGGLSIYVTGSKGVAISATTDITLSELREKKIHHIMYPDDMTGARVDGNTSQGKSFVSAAKSNSNSAAAAAAAEKQPTMSRKLAEDILLPTNNMLHSKLKEWEAYTKEVGQYLTLLIAVSPFEIKEKLIQSQKLKAAQSARDLFKFMEVLQQLCLEAHGDKRVSKEVNESILKDTAHIQYATLSQYIEKFKANWAACEKTNTTLNQADIVRLFLKNLNIRYFGDFLYRRHLDKTQLSSDKWVNLKTIEEAIKLVQQYDEEVVKTLAVTNDVPKIKFDDTTDILMNQHVTKDDTSDLSGSGNSGESLMMKKLTQQVAMLKNQLMQSKQKVEKQQEIIMNQQLSGSPSSKSNAGGKRADPFHGHTPPSVKSRGKDKHDEDDDSIVTTESNQLHVCYDFANSGTCSRGKSCRFSHRSDIVNAYKLRQSKKDKDLGKKAGGGFRK